ncbi:J domain-containing protein [Oryzihumus sp.]
MRLNGSDPYTILGVARNATEEQIRRAYRTLMRQNHPDTRPSGDPTLGAASNTTLEKAIAAYAILGDPASRDEYDHRTSAQHPRAAPWGDPGRWGGPGMRSSGAPDQPPIQAGPVRWHRRSG